MPRHFRLAITLVLLQCIVSSAHAQFPSSLDHDLLGNSGIRFRGVQAQERLGFSLSGLGDFNHDGVDDIAMAGIGSNITYVIYGDNTWGGSTSVSSLSSAQSLAATTTLLNSTFSNRERFIMGVGDVNDDGFNDLLVGTHLGGQYSYLLFGDSTYGAAYNVTAITSATGLVMEAEPVGQYMGTSVAGGGDFNGDGIDDFAISDPGVSLFSTITNDGRVYVIFGNTGIGGSIGLDSIPPGTSMVINAADQGGWLGFSLLSAGDVNGDGLDDLLMGADLTSINGVQYTGRAFLIYGSTNFPDTLNLDTLSASQGVVFNGQTFSGTGYGTAGSVGGGGDINGDGYADIVIGCPECPSGSTNGAGLAYVVFGDSSLPDTMELSSVASPNGFKVAGQASSHHFGGSSDFAGDVNNDGFGDLVIGARMADFISSSG